MSNDRFAWWPLSSGSSALPVPGSAARALRLDVLQHRRDVAVAKAQVRHHHLLVLRKQRRRDRVVVGEQLVWRLDEALEPRAIAHVRDADQIRSDAIFVTERVAGRAFAQLVDDQDSDRSLPRLFLGV